MRNSYIKKPVKTIVVDKKSVAELLDAMAETGFQGKKLGQAAQLWTKMVKDPGVTICLGYTGSLSTTGQWKMINWLIENRYIDVLVPTGANISEDLVEAMGKHYWQGTHTANDVDLLKADLNRYYDVYGKESDYLPMIELITDYIMTLDSHYNYSTREFLQGFGHWLNKKKVYSIVAAAAKHGVPVFCPAMVDSAYGDAILVAKARGFNLVLDQSKDFQEFMALGAKVKNFGVVYIGGGVPKDFIQLLAVSSPLQFTNKRLPGRKGSVHRPTNEGYYPHKYAIQITTDSPQWGGLSGCTLEEAISWGKITANEDHLTCYCEATIALPLIAHALNEKTKGKKRKGFDFAKAF